MGHLSLFLAIDGPHCALRARPRTKASGATLLKIKKPPGMIPGRQFHRGSGEAYLLLGSTKGRTLLSARPSLHWAGVL
jgi:hypothetical protein